MIQNVKIIFCFQFGKYPKIPYWVLIHPSRKTLYNDESTYKAITIRPNNEKVVTMTKIHLEAISSDDNPCISGDEATNMICKIEKVNIFLIMI